MNRLVNAIAGRLSLRAPQRQALEILDRMTEIIDFKKAVDLPLALRTIASEFPTVQDFEREFPSLCFALATGVGKTRLMGAFITYLHQAHGHKNFFVLAPNLTIYNKLIKDFTPSSPKYVFQGIADFAIEPPDIVTGDNYEYAPSMEDLYKVRINIFNISKINSEVRGGKNPRIKRLSEYLGTSYFEYLSSLNDLVLLMDESHRYRASAGVKAINELKPVMGLELTATPFVETSKGPIAFQNVVQDYPLARAMADGFVKEPAVVTRENFNPAGMSQQAIEEMKLKDGIRLHESTKVELETYARSTGNRIVKPFVLVIARDTTHAAELLKTIESERFFNGQYKGRAIQVDSSKSGAEEDEMIQRLLAVESPDEPTEIVIHVNMLKEGWDVTNLYTIIPLRAANARTLIEQSIGRGLRLPYGKRTGVEAVDRLHIVAHDKFQEIVEEAKNGNSVIRMEKIILTEADLIRKTQTIVTVSNLDTICGNTTGTSMGVLGAEEPKPLFTTPSEKAAANIALDVAKSFSNRPDLAPTIASLSSPEMRERIVKAVEERFTPAQTEMEGIVEKPDIAAIVEKTLKVMVGQTIEIPRIVVLPKEEVRSGFKPFTLALDFRFQPQSESLHGVGLRTGEHFTLEAKSAGVKEDRLEDYIVTPLIDCDDVSYDDHADLLYDLAGQVVEYLRSYLATEEEVQNVLESKAVTIAKLIHTQMLDHTWAEECEYESEVKLGFTPLKQTANSVGSGDILNFKTSPSDKSNMSRYLFTGFQRSLYPTAKFDSDSERRLATILDREAIKWFKPINGQFQIYYGKEGKEYNPDFVAETEDTIYMLEPKSRKEMEDPIVLEKMKSALNWCGTATDYSKKHGGKPWVYCLIPHDEILDNKTIKGLENEFRR